MTLIRCRTQIPQIMSKNSHYKDDKRRMLALAEDGKFVLRAQFTKAGYWVIVYYTINAGWKRMSKRSWYSSQEQANDEINELIKRSPNKFFKEEQI